MLVTVLIYSGIPNPSWAVPEVRAAEISRAIAAMPPLAAACPPQGGLGYSGVSVSVPNPDGTSQTWLFAKGVAAAGDRCFSDAGRKIERTLLKSGDGAIDRKLLQAILR
ncbi:MAG TPA: hypothetical protein VGF33_05925 [Caulobacteraceae bacterium]|jgi:hypothetical protein